MDSVGRGSTKKYLHLWKIPFPFNVGRWVVILAVGGGGGVLDFVLLSHCHTAHTAIILAGSSPLT